MAEKPTYMSMELFQQPLFHFMFESLPIAKRPIQANRSSHLNRTSPGLHFPNNIFVWGHARPHVYLIPKEEDNIEPNVFPIHQGVRGICDVLLWG